VLAHRWAGCWRTVGLINLGIIIASTRPRRVGGHIGRWVVARAQARPDVRVDVIDLAKLDLPFLDEEQDAASGVYRNPHTLAWSARVDALDAIVLVTSEYNSSFPAPLKNALDYLYREWRRKPVGIVAYGGLSSGTRVVHALMPVVTHLGMVPAGSMNIRFRERLDGNGVVRPNEADAEWLGELLDSVSDLARRMSLDPARS
jgi:NAD(P)H-dependent FMN reductase